jgi:hypothetical protein
MEQSYLPVQWVYREVIEEEMAKETTGTISISIAKMPLARLMAKWLKWRK